MQNQKELDELINSIMEKTPKQEEKEIAENEQAPVVSPVSKQAVEIRKQKMARIKEALANANDGKKTSSDKQESAPKHDKSKREKQAGVDTMEMPVSKIATASQTTKQEKAETIQNAEPVANKTEEEQHLDNMLDELQGSADAQTIDESFTERETSVSESPLPEKNPSKKKSGGATTARHGVPMQLIAAFLGVGLAASAVASYFLVANTYQEKFLPNTYVNAVKVDGMGIAEAEDTLIDNAGICEVTFVAADGKKATFSSDQFMGRYFVPSGALTDAAAEDPYQWFNKLFKPTQYNVNFDFIYSRPALRELITSFDWGDEESKNAQIVLNGDGSFEIEPESLGNKFDVATLMEYTANQLRLGVTTIDMLESGCYDNYRPEITAQDLAPQMDVYESFSHCNISYDFSDRKKVVDSGMILDWIATDENGHIITDMKGEVSFDRDKVSSFVAEMADETDTYGKPREFMSTLDGLITVPWNGESSSTYGWLINQEATVNQLINLMKAGESVTVEPEYKHRGYVRDRNDIGDTYVEVDISAQHVWVYIDGEVELSADCVTGTETDSSKRTPRGVCCILSKAEDVILGTYAVQGYEQFVDYWMPFNYLGCGFHDLSRGAYGGSIYMYNGSHGCVNLSWSVAKEMYNLVEVGMPALIHD